MRALDRDGSPGGGAGQTGGPAARSRQDHAELLQEHGLTERNFAIVDELLRIARELGTTPSAVALAWVQTQPGVTSTIIGARRFDQLDQNLAALDVKLDAAQAAALDRVSEPTLNFPAGFLAFAPPFMHAGATVNGEPSQVPPQMPKSDAERY